MKYDTPDDFNEIESQSLNDFADCIPKSPIADDPDMQIAIMIENHHSIKLRYM